MYSFKQKLPPTIAIAIALFTILSWAIGLSNSNVISAQGILYYLILAALSSCLAAYALVLGILEVIKLTR